MMNALLFFGLALWLISRSDLTSCRGYYFELNDVGGQKKRVKVCAPGTTLEFKRSTNSGNYRLSIWYIPSETNPPRITYERSNGQLVSVRSPYDIGGAPTGYYLTYRIKGRDYGHVGIGRPNEYLIRSANAYAFTTLADAIVRGNQIVDMINEEDEAPPTPPTEPETPPFPEKPPMDPPGDGPVAPPGNPPADPPVGPVGPIGPVGPVKLGPVGLNSDRAGIMQSRRPIL